ncbi:MAG: hypothetical protein ACFFEV_05805 [Candidatus Thorarchaeota archaeon]
MSRESWEYNMVGPLGFSGRLIRVLLESDAKKITTARRKTPRTA